MIKKALQKLSKKSLKKDDSIKKENFVQYMELVDDNLILFHRSKSFKEALTYDKAIELLIENKNIRITFEVNDVLERYYTEEMSA